MAGRGVCIVAYGANARAAAAQSIASLREHSDLQVRVIGERSQPDDPDQVEWFPCPQVDAGGRWAKLSLDSLSPFEHTLYLDADTRVRGKLGAGFEILEAGWDVVLTASTRQGPDVMGHAPLGDRNATFEAIGCREILGLQAGVMYFARNERTAALFAAWRKEWQLMRYLDQPALLRALYRVPVRLWLLGRPFNGGELVEHLFGRAR